MTDKKAIIAGNGLIPELLLEKFANENTKYFLIALKGSFLSKIINPDIYLEIGLVGELISILRKENITDIIFAGSIKRPPFDSLKLDIEGAKLLARITKRKLIGDDNILSTIISFLEERKFKVIKISEVLNDIIVPKGDLTEISANERDERDIKTAFKFLQAIGEYDIGQACIIENGLILGIEAAEGTDRLIDRCSLLRNSSSRSGILVKIKKPTQEDKIDVPTIGLETLNRVIDAGLKGIAVESKYSFILNKVELIKKSNQNNIFIKGI